MATRKKTNLPAPLLIAADDVIPPHTKIAPTILIGYQYNDNGAFIGAYAFEKNGDTEAVYLPRNITLLMPPDNVAIDQEVYFDGQQWGLRNLTLSGFPDRELPPDMEQDNKEITPNEN